MSNPIPAEPRSLATRPQYGSSPFREHLTRSESATLLAPWWASPSDRAPLTRTCTIFDAPSASAIIWLASEAQAPVTASASAP